MKIKSRGGTGWFFSGRMLRVGISAGTTGLKTVTNIYSLDALLSGNWQALLSVVWHLVLPTVTLGLILSGVFVRMTRVNIDRAVSLYFAKSPDRTPSAL